MPHFRGMRFVGQPVDRAATHKVRRDPAALQNILDGPNARFLPVHLVKDPAVLTTSTEPLAVIWWTRAELLALGANADHGAIYLGPVVECSRGADQRAEAFAVDVGGFLTTELAQSLASKAQRWTSGRELALFTKAADADVSMAGLALALSSWSASAQYHPASGLATIPVEGGVKRQEVDGRRKLYPRTDPVAIGLIVSPDGMRVLLHKRKDARGPYQHLYTCISGFVDQCESVEDAFMREACEEVGVELAQVSLLASQGWPLGRSGACELMVGCTAVAASEKLQVNLDEVADARWFTKAEVLCMLERRHLDGLVVPPPAAIAHHLISQWASAAAPSEELAQLGRAFQLATAGVLGVFLGIAFARLRARL